MKCPVCKFARCRWIELSKTPERIATERLEQVINHNISYIEMIFKDHQGSANAEERMYDRLSPYSDELERRKKPGGDR